jgi:hypothetical protein
MPLLLAAVNTRFKAHKRKLHDHLPFVPHDRRYQHLFVMTNQFGKVDRMVANAKRFSWK